MAITRIGPAHTKGFTLLEAIVALAVMSLALIPLVSFVAQSANELVLAGEANERSFTMQSALALMEPVNPMAEPKGSLVLDPTISVSWDSQEIVKPNDAPLIGSGLANFRLGFYTTHVTVFRNNAPWFLFDMRKVGYEKFSSGMPFGDTK